ncbi:MAG: hypothetical protein PHR06_12675, partial [Candidatus Cloacimonetes bacterium]|nr:hypothetical protein [Candidatus Cloacimonadota bacterium]
LKAAEKFIESIPSDTEESELNLCKGILFFYKKDFSTAINFLEKSNDTAYNYLKFILIGNCMLEINSTNHRFSEKAIFQQFQNAMDNCNSQSTKEVIKIHIKFARYGGINNA